MKKAACGVAILAGTVLVISVVGRNIGSEGFVADVRAEEASDTQDDREEYISQIDTSVSVVPGGRIAVVSKSVKGEFWDLVHEGMEDAIKDLNKAYGFEGDEALTMTFEGPDDEQDVETQVNTLDAVISENPSVLCLSASDMDSLQAQLEAASENGIPVIVFDSNVSENELVTAFRATDNEKVGTIAGEKMAEALTDGGKVAVFAAQEKTESSQKRVVAFENALKDRSDITIVEKIYMDQVEDMATAISETLENNQDLAGVFCSNADVAELYLSVAEGENLPVMIGVDATTNQQTAVNDGREYGIVSQAPYDMGYQTILAAAQATVSPFPSEGLEETVLLEPQWLDSSNIEDSSLSKYLYH